MEKVTVPEGISGDYKVKRFTVTEEAAKATSLRSIFQGGRGYVPPGVYTEIQQCGVLWMSDTPDELRDHSYFVWKAGKVGGDILITGLGLGAVVHNLIAKPTVSSITVIEVSSDVIKLVAPHYEKAPRVQVIEADAFTWKPEKGCRFDAIWHDIWPNLSSANLAEMTRLARRYGRWLKPGGYQDCWGKELCRQRRRQWYG